MTESAEQAESADAWVGADYGVTVGSPAQTPGNL